MWPWRRRSDEDFTEEIQSNIALETDRLIAEGLTPEAARTAALRAFGSVTRAQEHFYESQRLVWLNDLTRDILYAFRTFRKAPLAALTIVLTVALGLGLVTAVFEVYSIFVLRPDAVPRPGELFAVRWERITGPGTDEDVAFTRPDYEAMRRDTSVFVDAFAMPSSSDASNVNRIEGRPARAALVTGNFFQVLGVQAALGRSLVPGDDERFAGQPVIVLSHVGWHKLFQADPAVIGRRVEVSGSPFEIVGVMPDGFRGLSLTPPDYWAPLALAGRFRDASAGREDKIVLEVVGRLKPDMSPEAAAAGLAVWASGQIDPKKNAASPATITLTQRQGTLSDGYGTLEGPLYALFVFSPMFFAFGLILIIGCANVANLLLARGVSRQREIGTRLSLGASRPRIVRQLLTESLLLSLVAAALGLVVSRLFLVGVLYAVFATLPPELAQFVNLFNLAAPARDWRVLIFLAGAAMVSTTFFGLVPALQATRLDLVRTMRGEVTRDARPGRARNALIAVQVGASALLLICTVIFLRGAFAAWTSDPGVRTADTLRVSVANEPRRAALLQALAADPLVSAVAAESGSTRGVVEVGGAEGLSRLPVGQMGVSSGYFDVLGIEVVSGRAFTPAERTADAGVVIVSEVIARRLWPDGDGVGRLLRVDGPSSSAEARSAKAERTMRVVGVVRDPGSASGMGSNTPNTFRGIYLPAGLESNGAWLWLRVRGNPEQARVVLLERLARVDPGLTNILTFRTIARGLAYILQIGVWVTVALGGLALLLTVSGLFSVLSYVVEQRAKEIGVRMALGATARNVVQLVLSQSVRPVAVGLVAGSALAAALAIVLTSISDGGNMVDVFDPVAYVASLLIVVTASLLAVSVPSLRAARIDPIETLRKD